MLRAVLFRIIGVLLGFLVAFAMAEGAVRLFCPQEVGPVRFACHPQLGEIPVPGQHGVRRLPGVFTSTYSNNSLGWRGSREYREAKQTEYRVLFLGDSFTYGIGVNDDQTFAALVEKFLTSDHLSVEVMNAGDPGKGTDYALKLYQTVGRKFYPDLVVYCAFFAMIYRNERGEYYNVGNHGDLQAKAVICRGGLIKTVLAHLPGYNWLISWSQAANLVKEAGVELLIKWATRNGSDVTEGLVLAYKKNANGCSTEANKLTRIYADQLHAAVKNAGGKLVIFYIPNSQEVREYRQNRTFSADEQVFQLIAADNGMTLWSLTPLLAHSGQPIDRLYYKEGHWTAVAHELAAHYMSGLIESRLLQNPQLKPSDP
ncbi:MAG: hypothetical protein WBV23_06205 [Desulfobaccales bacterium]